MPCLLRRLALLALLLLGPAAALAQGPIEFPPRLLFWSGFEGATALAKPGDCYANGCWQELIGSDGAGGFAWPPSLRGGGARFQLIANAAEAPTPATIGRWMVNEIRTVRGHRGVPTRALYSEIRQSGCCGTRPQGGGSTQDALLVMPGAEPGDLYLSKWMMLQPDLLEKLHAGDAWRAIFEWKEGVANDGTFRVSLGIVAYDRTPLTWQVAWDNLAGPVARHEEYYRKYNRQVRVPVGEWFKLEVFWHRSKGGDGRTWFAVNGQVIDDHRGRTVGVNERPVGRIFANQLYSGSPYPIYQWMDDLQIWSGFPAARPGDPWYDPPYAPH
jgi:hypothetical protein